MEVFDVCGVGNYYFNVRTLVKGGRRPGIVGEIDRLQKVIAPRYVWHRVVDGINSAIVIQIALAPKESRLSRRIPEKGTEVSRCSRIVVVQIFQDVDPALLTRNPSSDRGASGGLPTGPRTYI